MLPAIPYEVLLHIHREISVGATTILGMKVERFDSNARKFFRVTVEDERHVKWVFITQNMQKSSSPDTQRILAASLTGETINITWICSTGSFQYYGKIESSLTSKHQRMFIEDFGGKRIVYDCSFERKPNSVLAV